MKIRSTLATVALALTASQAAEISFSGSVDAGYKADLGTLEDAPASMYNLEANLTMDAKLSDKVSAQLYATSLAGGVPASFGPGLNEDGSYAARWPAFAFDGATINLKTSETGTLSFGDLVYAKGSIGYYAAKRYSSVVRVAALKGASYTDGGFSIYAGANDANDNFTTIGSGYLATLGEGTSLDVFGNVHLGGSDGDLPWGAGAQYKAKLGDLSLAASGAGYGGNGADGDHHFGYVLAGEANYASAAAYVSSFALFAPKAEAAGKGEWAEFAYPVRQGRSYAAWGNDLSVYVEPGMNFGGMFAAGLPIEWHDPSLDVEKDEMIYFVPSFYINAAEGTSITLWAEGDVYTEDDKDMTYAWGMETIFKF